MKELHRRRRCCRPDIKGRPRTRWRERGFEMHRVMYTFASTYRVHASVCLHVPMCYVNVTSLYKCKLERKEWPDITSMQTTRLSFSLLLSGKTTFVSDGRLAFPRSTWLHSIEFSLTSEPPPRKLCRERERHTTGRRISPEPKSILDDTHCFLLVSCS